MTDYRSDIVLNSLNINTKDLFNEFVELLCLCLVHAKENNIELCRCVFVINERFYVFVFKWANNDALKIDRKILEEVEQDVFLDCINDGYKLIK